jgi:hypothetical protein
MNELRKCGTYIQWNFIQPQSMLLFAGKWTELENIILNEASQAQMAKNCLFSLICGIMT